LDGFLCFARCFEYDETPAAAVATDEEQSEHLMSPSPIAGVRRPRCRAFLTNTGMETRFVPTSEPIAAMNQRGDDVGLKFDFLDDIY